MNRGIAAVAVGATLIVTGLLLLRSHRRSWALQQQDPECDPEDLKHYRRRYRRRLQTSGLLVVLGVLIPAGDQFIPANAPGIFTAWVGLVLLLTLQMIGLGLSDMLATATHSQAALARIHRKQHELEGSAQMARRHHSNGTGGPAGHSGNEPSI